MLHVAFANPLWMSQVPESISVAAATWVEATELSPKEIDIACKGDVLHSVRDRTSEYQGGVTVLNKIHQNVSICTSAFTDLNILTMSGCFKRNCLHEQLSFASCYRKCMHILKNNKIMVLKLIRVFLLRHFSFMWYPEMMPSLPSFLSVRGVGGLKTLAFVTVFFTRHM